MLFNAGNWIRLSNGTYRKVAGVTCPHGIPSVDYFDDDFNKSAPQSDITAIYHSRCDDFDLCDHCYHEWYEFTTGVFVCEKCYLMRGK